MVRAIERVGFAHEVTQLNQNCGAQIRVLGSVCYYVDEMPWSDGGRERKLMEILAGNYRRIFELLDGGCCELSGDACRRHGISAGADGRERRADAPAGWN